MTRKRLLKHLAVLAWLALLFFGSANFATPPVQAIGFCGTASG